MEQSVSRLNSKSKETEKINIKGVFLLRLATDVPMTCDHVNINIITRLRLATNVSVTIRSFAHFIIYKLQVLQTS